MFSAVFEYMRQGNVEKFQVAHVVFGFALFLFSIVISVATQYADSNFLLLAALGLFNLLYAPLVPVWQCSNKQAMQHVVSFLLLLAAMLQAVFLVVLLFAVAELEEAPVFYDASAFAVAILLAAVVIHLILHFGECLRALPTDSPQVDEPEPQYEEYEVEEQQVSFANHSVSRFADAPREQGLVKWFNTSKGFGFIERDNGGDIFVHFRAIRGDGHRVLFEGDRVEYVVLEHEKGLQANDVLVLEDN